MEPEAQVVILDTEAYRLGVQFTDDTHNNTLLWEEFVRVNKANLWALGWIDAFDNIPDPEGYRRVLLSQRTFNKGELIERERKAAQE